jgi:hypothetical protein
MSTTMVDLSHFWRMLARDNNMCFFHDFFADLEMLTSRRFYVYPAQNCVLRFGVEAFVVLSIN